MSKRVIVEGKAFIVPDDATPEEIDEIAGGPPAGTTVPDDHDKALSKDTGFWAGMKRGATGLVEGARAALEGVDPTEPMGAGVARIAVNLGKGMKAGIESEAEKAGALMDVEGPGARGPSGRGLSATGHMIAAAVPGVGPYAANLVERGASGDVSGAVGEFIPGLLASEIPRAAMGAVGKAARTAESTATAGGIAREGMSATRVASAAKNAEELAAANKAGLDLQEWLRVDRQTPDVLTNRAAGIKPKHFKGGYEPTAGARRTGVIEDFDQPTTKTIEAVRGKMDELGGQKKAILDRGNVAASEADLISGDDLFQGVMEDAHATGNKNLVRKIATTRKSLLDTVDTSVVKELSSAEVQKLIKRVDRFIEVNTGVGAKPLRRALEQYRKRLQGLEEKANPDIAPVNKDIRDLIPVRRAAEEKLMGELADTGDESTLKPPPMKEPAIPAPGQDIPPDLMERIKNMTPAEKLKLFAEGGEMMLPWYLRGPVRLGRRLAK
jgi:hypothetical protein